MRICTVVGARPQFVKAAMVSPALRCHEVLIHTGQHYDHSMSQVFFDDLALPTPDYNLEIGSGDHGAQTGRMLERIEQVLLKEQPDRVLVYGDTNSTLAGALAAAKLNIPVAHVEAGLRSFDLTMPEEINRVLTDHVSSTLFCPTQAAWDNLTHEGIIAGVHLVGDVLYDAILFYIGVAERRSNVLTELGVTPGDYLLATVHRPCNTDTPHRLRSILDALGGLGKVVVLPLHPRTREAMESYTPSPHLRLIPPVGYLDMLVLEKNAGAVLTDSGGVQREAYLLGVPCIVLRDRTEWEELGHTLVGADPGLIAKAAYNLHLPPHRDALGGGWSAQAIAEVLCS